MLSERLARLKQQYEWGDIPAGEYTREGDEIKAALAALQEPEVTAVADAAEYFHGASVKRCNGRGAVRHDAGDAGRGGLRPGSCRPVLTKPIEHRSVSLTCKWEQACPSGRSRRIGDYA